MNHIRKTKLSRRSFVVGTAAGRRRPVARLPPAARSRERRCRDRARRCCPCGSRCGRRGQCLGGDQARRHLHDPDCPHRDGPGHQDRPRPAGGRRTRMRLEEGDDRIPSRRARTSPASASGARWVPAAAAASALRRTMSAVAARQRESCCSRPQPTSGRSRSASSRSPTASSPMRRASAAISYGKIAAAAAKVAPPDPKSIKLKDPHDWKIAGKPMKRLDTAEKLNGSKIYAIDLKMPKMLCAAIKDSPVFGGKVKSYDEAKIAGRPGVKGVVKVKDSAVAVVADTWYRAKSALEALPIEWDTAENGAVSSDSIAEHLRDGFRGRQQQWQSPERRCCQGHRGRSEEDRGGLFDPIPRPCHHGADELHRQGVGESRRGLGAVAERRGFARGAVGSLRGAARKVRGIQARSGRRLRPARRDAGLCAPGGGDRQGIPRHAGETHLVARRGHDPRLLPADLASQMSAGLDENSNLVGLHVRISGQSINAFLNPALVAGGKDMRQLQGYDEKPGEAQLGYAAPNMLIEYVMRNTHVPVGPWRGVNTNQNAVYMECFMDEIARAAGKDPVEFRRSLMADYPEPSGAPQRRRRKGRMGQTAAGGRSSRHRPVLRLRDLFGCRRRGLGERRRAS